MDVPPPPPQGAAEQSNFPLPTAAAINNNPPYSSNDSSNVSPGILITVLILAIAVILSASLYLLLRFLRRRRSTTSSTSILPNSLHHHHHQQRHQNNRRISSSEKNPLIDSLPLFSFNSLTGSVGGGDCAVCLSKFEEKDLLRLLPICCHAFHVECIDTWLAANQSCPLCRSPIFLPDAELLGKFRNSLSSSSLSSLTSPSGSFRVEIGNVSRRAPVAGGNSGEIRRSYSISGSYDYVLDDPVSDVPMCSFLWPSDFKVEPTPVPTSEDQEALAAEVGPRGSWLKEYLSQSLSSSSSRTASFRGFGGWFFSGSSRRSTQEFTDGNHESPFDVDLEAGQLGDEIGELFRWLSGV